MKILTTILVAWCAIMFHSNILAATSEVTWTEYKKYRDIQPGNEHPTHFRERTFKNFEKHFNGLAQRLPEGLTLKIEVTDVDLAGDTLIGGINRLRIIKELYSPRLTFSYQLLGSDGTQIAAESVKLRDMNFMTGTSLRYRHDALGYEKKMLDDWFKTTFKEHIVEKRY